PDATAFSAPRRTRSRHRAKGIALALLLRLSLTTVRATLARVTVAALRDPNALRRSGGISRRLHSIVRPGREFKRTPLARDPSERSAVFGLVGLGPNTFSLSAVGPAGNGPQTVCEGDDQCGGGDHPDYHRSRVVPHEPQAHCRSIEETGTERDEAEDNCADHPVDPGVGAPVAVARRESDAHDTQQRSQTSEQSARVSRVPCLPWRVRMPPRRARSP